MCGIAGVLDPACATAGDELVRLAETMSNALAHRGPDDAATWCDPAAGIGLGFRRLAIVDPSVAGRQPMTASSGRCVVVFNGELYNHRRLRNELEARGRRFRGSSDTEVLCEAIDEWGLARTLDRSVGMFALAVWSVPERVLRLARDRIGEKPLYYGEVDGRFAFASELRALRALPAFDSEIDPAAVASVVRWSFVHHPLTIYRSVSTLPPGSMLEVDARGGTVTHHLSRWWSLEDVVADGAPGRATTAPADADDQLVARLDEAVGARLQGDVPVGAFLSGGVDSSVVAAFAQRHIGGRLRTFTVAMPEVGFDESADAAAVACALGTDHTAVELGVGDALSLVPHLAEIYDEPFGDPSMLPTALLCRTVGRSLTVCLSGDGGDEVFGGYNRHVFGPAVWRAAGWVPRAARRSAGRVLLMASPHAVDATARRAARWARLPPNPSGKVQRLATLLAGGDGLWDSLASAWPADEWPLRSPPTPPPFDAPHDVSATEALLIADTALALPDQMLVKVDRASMAVGLEVRVPLLDPSLVAWSWSLPLAQKVGHREGKRILKRVLRELVPAEIVDRPKMGFDPPIGTWLRGPLRPWAETLLAAPRLTDEGFLDAGVVRRTWDEHLAGRRNWDQRLWSVLMLEAWLDRWAGPVQV